jgi:hypothetical protein
LRAGIVQTSTAEFDDLNKAHQEPMGTVVGTYVIPARNLIG